MCSRTVTACKSCLRPRPADSGTTVRPGHALRMLLCAPSGCAPTLGIRPEAPTDFLRLRPPCVLSRENVVRVVVEEDDLNLPRVWDLDDHLLSLDVVVLTDHLEKAFDDFSSDTILLPVVNCQLLVNHPLHPGLGTAATLLLAEKNDVVELGGSLPGHLLVRPKPDGYFRGDGERLPQPSVCFMGNPKNWHDSSYRTAK